MSPWKAAIVVAGSALLLTACGGGNPNTGGGGGSSCTTSSGATATQVVQINPDPNTVGRFDPNTVNINVGQSVEWDWIDTSSQHSTTSDTGGIWDSCLQNAGFKFVFTFNTAGTYTYHCTIHAAMTGKIVVT
jgi:plastocyanin